MSHDWGTGVNRQEEPTMKRFAMLIVAALLTAPVFAADLCDINL
ncbi:hypothetical protein NVV93_16100 [Pseudomonas sp. LS44]|nr:hypothetical protein [Pseudomonas sp. LS44]UVE17091.1 hypothetical protein NVV93_16100 [Pseudomonas sp. LS44]